MIGVTFMCYVMVSKICWIIKYILIVIPRTKRKCILKHTRQSRKRNEWIILWFKKWFSAPVQLQREFIKNKLFLAMRKWNLQFMLLLPIDLCRPNILNCGYSFRYRMLCVRYSIHWFSKTELSYIFILFKTKWINFYSIEWNHFFGAEM